MKAKLLKPLKLNKISVWVKSHEKVLFIHQQSTTSKRCRPRVTRFDLGHPKAVTGFDLGHQKPTRFYLDHPKVTNIWSGPSKSQPDLIWVIRTKGDQIWSGPSKGDPYPSSFPFGKHKHEKKAQIGWTSFFFSCYGCQRQALLAKQMGGKNPIQRGESSKNTTGHLNPKP